MRYKIKFYTYWHCGSGLSAGSSNDAMVVRDGKGLPFVPGRTIKGHLREMAELLDDNNFIQTCFGEADDKPSDCFFTDAVCYADLEPSSTKYLFDSIASTKIDEESGVAKDDTLRSIEVVVPMTLYGSVENLPEEFIAPMQKVMRMVKRIGTQRNRGLGRCDIIPEGGER